MKIEYKFCFITRDDDGFIVNCGIRYYEGDVTTEDEKDMFGKLASITRHRRTKRLKKIDLPHLATREVKLEAILIDGKMFFGGGEAFLYTPKDFGQIKTDDELRVFLNSELRKDTRTPVDEQNTLDIKKVQ
jgi:hypothetical protein